MSYLQKMLIKMLKDKLTKEELEEVVLNIRNCMNKKIAKILKNEQLNNIDALYEIEKLI